MLHVTFFIATSQSGSDDHIALVYKGYINTKKVA